MAPSVLSDFFANASTLEDAHHHHVLRTSGLLKDMPGIITSSSSTSSSSSLSDVSKSTSFYLVDLTAKLLGMRVPDDPQSEFRTGHPRLIPQTSVPIPISPNYLTNQYDRRVFAAAQQ